MGPIQYGSALYDGSVPGNVDGDIIFRAEDDRKCGCGIACIDATFITDVPGIKAVVPLFEDAVIRFAVDGDVKGDGVIVAGNLLVKGRKDVFVRL